MRDLSIDFSIVLYWLKELGGTSFTTIDRMFFECCCET